MLEKFRNCYPQGSLVGKLINIDRGLYIVRVSITVDEVILATGLAAADKLEIAEDRARERAIAALTLEKDTTSVSQIKPIATAKQSVVSNGKETNNQSPVINGSPTVVKSPQPQAATTVPSEQLHPETPESSVSPAIAPQLQPEFSPIKPPVESQVVIDKATDNSGNLFDGTYDDQASETVALEPPEVAVTLPPEPEVPDSTVKIDFYAIKHETDIELERLGWTNNEGRDFLKRKYGKPSRLRLTDEELLEFLQHLKSLPTPS